MSSLPLDFTFGNVEHKVTLEKTDSVSEKALSIDGRYYKLLGSQEALALINSRLESLPSSDFATFKALEISLLGAGPSEKTATLFQKVVVKPPTLPSVQAITEKIRKCNGSQLEVKRILFENVGSKENIPHLMEVALHLAHEGESIKAGYAYYFTQKLLPEAERPHSLLQMGKALLSHGKEANDLLALELAEFHLQMAQDSQNQTVRQEAKSLINDDIISCAKQIQATGKGYAKEAAGDLLDCIEIRNLLSQTPSLLQTGKALFKHGKEANDLRALDLAEFHLQMAPEQEAKSLINDIILCVKQIQATGPAEIKEDARKLLERLETTSSRSQLPPGQERPSYEIVKHYGDWPCTNRQVLEEFKKDVKSIRDAFTLAETYQKRVDARKIESPGKLCEIRDGHSLLSMHVKVTGTRREKEPIVILESGLGSTSNDWTYVQDLLGSNGPLTISYDRAGLGWSQRGKGSPSCEQSLTRLEAILDALKLSDGPILFVGHSYGGVLAQLFTLKHSQNHPNLVCGMILVDSATGASQTEPFLRKTVSEQLPPAINHGKFHHAYDERTALGANRITAQTQHFETMIEESYECGPSLKLLSERLDQSKTSKTHPFEIPIKVISAGLSDFNQDLQVDEEWHKEWTPFSESQKELLERSEQTEQIVAEKSAHFVMHYQPELVVKQILEWFPDRVKS